MTPKPRMFWIEVRNILILISFLMFELQTHFFEYVKQFTSPDIHSVIRAFVALISGVPFYFLGTVMGVLYSTKSSYAVRSTQALRRLRLIFFVK